MEKTPEALRLADELTEEISGYTDPTDLELKAAAELRRLHDENEHLRMSQYGSGRLQMLRNQRDELLAALQKTQVLLERLGFTSADEYQCNAYAIAKATGQ